MEPVIKWILRISGAIVGLLIVAAALLFWSIKRGWSMGFPLPYGATFSYISIIAIGAILFLSALLPWVPNPEGWKEVLGSVTSYTDSDCIG